MSSARGKGKEKDKTLSKSLEQEIESYAIKKRKRKYIDTLINTFTDPETIENARSQARVKSQGFADNLESALQSFSSPAQRFSWERAISYTYSYTVDLFLQSSSINEKGLLSKEANRIEQEVEEAAATLIQANAQSQSQSQSQSNNKAIFDNFFKQFNDFIGFKDGSSLSTILSTLLNYKKPQQVEDFFAHSKYFLKNYIYESNNEIMTFSLDNKNEKSISEIKERVQQAENMYLALKKLEKAYYRADRERSYFEARNKIISDDLIANAAKKRNHNSDYDAKHSIENTGIALHPQYWAEKVDPQHRHWGPLNKQLGILKENWRNVDHNQNLFDFVLDGSTPKDKYLDETRRKNFLVKIKDGKIVFSSDSTPPKENVELSYVMDLRGNLYIEKENQIPHPTFLAGENVKCAGKLFIQDGKIISINNDSKYYPSGPFALNSTLNILEKNNMLDYNVIVENTNNSITNNVNLIEYKTKFSELEDNYGITFLNTIKEMNVYMKKRAKETREYGFTSKLFGYSGQDYYDRREHWENVLEGLLKVNSETSLTTVLSTINAGIQQFGKTGRRDYANKLQVLYDQLSKQNQSNQFSSLAYLNKPYIRKYLTSSKKVYDNLGSVSRSVNDYITAEDKNDEIKNLSNFTHRLSGHRLKAKGRNEFLTKAEVKETEFTNSLSGRYKRA